MPEAASVVCYFLPRNKDARKFTPFLSLCKASSRVFCRTLASLSFFFSATDFVLLFRCLLSLLPFKRAMVAGINHLVGLTFGGLLMF